MLIQGQGGGGSSSSSSSRVPVDAADTVQSQAVLSLIDLLGEGQIGGLVDGARSIFIDGTPLVNPDGTNNYSGFTYQERTGSQGQTNMEGFPDVETPYNVNVQVKVGLPNTFTITSDDIDQVRVTVNIPSLYSQDQRTGDSNGTTVQYQFQMSVNGGPFNPVIGAGEESATITIKAKSRSKYQRAHLFTLPETFTTCRMRMVRITADSTSAYLGNETWLDSYSEIINSKLTYPNSALVGMSIDAKQFQSVPERSYLVNGLYVKVPSNYDAATRTYSGVWDGTFKVAVTSNPAWILNDVLTNTRYGLGNFVKQSQVNIGQLYQIGRYCDQMLSDGFGGQEPRFAINTVIQSQVDAYQLITDICSAFRGMSYWAGGMVNITQDSPTDAQFLFTNANVVDGLFNEVGSARKDRHSVVHVRWNDPEDNYKQKLEYVEDPELVKSMGIRKTEVTGFGCTSRAQAHRIGRWILYTEKMESGIISFGVGLEALQVMPGDIIKIHDQWAAGKRNGGRLVSCTRVGCTLDKPTSVQAGAIIAIRMPNGQYEERAVNQTGTVTQLTFATQLSAQPEKNTVWMLSEPNLVPVTARVVGIAQSETRNVYTISAVEHNPSKFGAIDEDLTLEEIPTTILDPTYSTPENLSIQEVTYLASPGNIASRLDVSWTGKSPRYYLWWRATIPGGVAGNWNQIDTTAPAFELQNVLEGVIYDFRVAGMSVTGKLSAELVGTYTVLGSHNPPGPPTNLTAAGDFRAIILNWVNDDAIDLDHVEIWENSAPDLETASKIAKSTSSTFTRAGLPGLTTRYYWVRSVNRRGLTSPFNSNLGTAATTVQATHDDVVKQFIDKSLLVPELVAGLDGNSAVMGQLQEYFDLAAATQSKVDQYADKIAALEQFVSSFGEGDLQYVTKEELLTAKNETQQAVIDTLTGVMVGPGGAIATAVQNLKTEVDGKFSELSITAQTIDGLMSQYTVKIDNNGYISGFGLASSSNNGVPESEFLVVADRFAIAQPNQGQGATYPFVVTTVNGIPRVSMNSAFITEIVAAIMKSPDNKFRIDLQNKLISIEV